MEGANGVKSDQSSKLNEGSQKWCPSPYAERTTQFGYNVSNPVARVESEFNGAGKTTLYTRLVKARTGPSLRTDSKRHH